MSRFALLIIVLLSICIAGPALAEGKKEVLHRIQVQPGKLKTGEFYVGAGLQTMKWGYLPNRKSRAILTVPSGSVVIFDLLSSEGIMEDQGRDPVKFFGKYSVAPGDVLDDAKEIAGSSLKHDFDQDGPHVVLGPVAIEGAKPGDVLKVEVLSYTPRVPYGVIANNHGSGVLKEYPQNKGRQPGASAAKPEAFNNVKTFVALKNVGGRIEGVIRGKNGKEVSFPIDPFIGTIGTAPAVDVPVSSVPPSATFGGNLDLKELTVGAKLYLPIQLPGGMFFIGDPHFAQGNGEVAGTALEASLRAKLKLTVIKAHHASIPGKGPLSGPVVETTNHWVVIGLAPDLSVALKNAVRAAIKFVVAETGMAEAEAYAYLSAAADFSITQAVDRVVGVHAKIRKTDLRKAKRQPSKN